MPASCQVLEHAKPEFLHFSARVVSGAAPALHSADRSPFLRSTAGTLVPPARYGSVLNCKQFPYQLWHMQFSYQLWHKQFPCRSRHKQFPCRSRHMQLPFQSRHMQFPCQSRHMHTGLYAWDWICLRFYRSIFKLKHMEYLSMHSRFDCSI